MSAAKSCRANVSMTVTTTAQVGVSTAGEPTTSRLTNSVIANAMNAIETVVPSCGHRVWATVMIRPDGGQFDVCPGCTKDEIERERAKIAKAKALGQIQAAESNPDAMRELVNAITALAKSRPGMTLTANDLPIDLRKRTLKVGGPAFGVVARTGLIEWTGKVEESSLPSTKGATVKVWKVRDAA